MKVSKLICVEKIGNEYYLFPILMVRELHVCFHDSSSLRFLSNLVTPKFASFRYFHGFLEINHVNYNSLQREYFQKYGDTDY